MLQLGKPFESRNVSSKGRERITTPGLVQSHLFWVLSVALVLRLIVLLIVITRYPPKWLFGRGIEMGLLAQSLLAGEGLSSPFGGHTGPTAFIAPAYPILIAVVFKVFGSFSSASAIAIITVQIMLNLATIWFIMHLARQLFDQSAATVAGLIWAASLPLMWLPTIFWETSLSSCLLIGLVALAHTLGGTLQITKTVWLCVGAYCGLSVLVNPALMLPVLAVALWLIYQHRKSAGYRPLLSLLAAVLVFSPWPIRNAITFHAFIPLRTTVGFELWMGNREDATGFLDESLFPMFNRVELNDYITQGEVRYSQHKAELALMFISRHPARFVQLTSLRAIRFWTGTGTQNGSIFFLIHALFTTLAGFAGLILLFRSQRYAIALLFVLPIFLFQFPYLITHAEFRYRIVIDALLAVISGFTVTKLYSILSRTRSPGVLANNLACSTTSV